MLIKFNNHLLYTVSNSYKKFVHITKCQERIIFICYYNNNNYVSILHYYKKERIRIDYQCGSVRNFIPEIFNINNEKTILIDFLISPFTSYKNFCETGNYNTFFKFIKNLKKNHVN